MRFKVLTECLRIFRPEYEYTLLKIGYSKRPSSTIHIKMEHAYVHFITSLISAFSDEQFSQKTKTHRTILVLDSSTQVLVKS